jgi:hypothetical protein
MENVKEPFSTTEMVAEIFKAMSEASGRGVSCLYQVAFSGRLLPK